MPIIHRKNISSKSHLAIWEIKESVEELITLYRPDEDELNALNSFTHDHRKAQWLAVRSLLHELVPGEKIRYDENGKPWPKNSNCYISVSHSGPMVAIFICDAACGIDIEHIRPKIERIAPRFLNTEELAAAKKDPVVERMHAYWCVKEAAYKVNGKKNVSLRENISVSAFNYSDQGETNVEVNSGDHSFGTTVNFERNGEYMLAWTCVKQQ